MQGVRVVAVDVRGVMIIGDFYNVPVYDVRFSLIRCLYTLLNKTVSQFHTACKQM